MPQGRHRPTEKHVLKAVKACRVFPLALQDDPASLEGGTPLKRPVLEASSRAWQGTLELPLLERTCGFKPGVVTCILKSTAFNRPGLR